MYEARFSPWQSWGRRRKLRGLELPGVYAIAYTGRDISGKRFEWRKEIIYVGMTNAVSGLKWRLNQFDNTIFGKRGHGGADRVRFKYPNYAKLVKKLYVSVAPFKCNVKSNHPTDLRKMGDVAKFEYMSFAHFVERFKKLPKFNNKKESPKYSKTRGDSA